MTSGKGRGSEELKLMVELKGHRTSLARCGRDEAIDATMGSQKSIFTLKSKERWMRTDSRGFAALSLSAG